MPFTVITLTNVPPSLRGDLTKWMQEISTGVYVGNFNSRIREHIWKRVCDSVESGEATISYSYHNEIGYNFQTINSGRSVIDCDGIPLVMIPSEPREQESLANGFSSAYKMHKARVVTRVKPERDSVAREAVKKKGKPKERYVVLDIETTGLDASHDAIIEIGAVKYEDGETSLLQDLIDIHKKIPEKIVQLTGITDTMLTDAKELKPVLERLVNFIEDLPLVGYNINFDVQFLNAALESQGLPVIRNRTIDLMKLVKKDFLFLSNYKLSSVLKSYGISNSVPHRALEDAKLIFQLSKKVNNFRDVLCKEG